MEIQKLQEELSKNLLGDNRRLCKNCKWAKKDLTLNILTFWLFGWKFGQCDRPSLPKSLVDGKIESKFLDLQREYSFGDYCGPEGKYFERKK